jgi:hypothetical protein
VSNPLSPLPAYLALSGRGGASYVRFSAWVSALHKTIGIRAGALSANFAIMVF